MKRKDSTCSQWRTDNDRLLLQFNRLEENDRAFSIVPAFVSREELKQLGEAIIEALVISDLENPNHE